MGSQVGFFLIVAGVVIALAGLLAWSGAFSWFGKLPGDVRIERENFVLYIPLASMAVVSLLLSVVLHLIKRFFS